MAFGSIVAGEGLTAFLFAVGTMELWRAEIEGTIVSRGQALCLYWRCRRTPNLVRRLYRDRRRMVRDVAISGLERPAGGLSHYRVDSPNCDLRRSTGLRATLGAAGFVPCSDGSRPSLALRWRGCGLQSTIRQEVTVTGGVFFRCDVPPSPSAKSHGNAPHGALQGTDREWQKRVGYDPFAKRSGKARLLRVAVARRSGSEGRRREARGAPLERRPRPLPRPEKPRKRRMPSASVTDS